MVILEKAMIRLVKYPDMRLQVVDALRSLSDVRHQQTMWGQYVEGSNYYDDLDLNIHILYDDCLALPEPQEAVPHVLHAEEVPIFLQLERALGPMIADLGDAPDETYTSDPRWAAVVTAAGAALEVMERLDRDTTL
jgi:hypothetical protein